MTASPMRATIAFVDRFSGVFVLLGLLAGWEIVGRLELVEPPAFVPPLTQVLLTLGRLLMSADFRLHIVDTLLRTFCGLTLAAAVGIPLGLWMGYSPRARRALNATVEALRPIPPAAAIPIAIAFLGIGSTMKVAVITFGCAWPILLNSLEGVRNIPEVLFDTARTLNVRGRLFAWEIVVKGAAPYIVTGVRISLAIALILAIVTEMIAGTGGLGFFIIIAERSFRFDEMYAGVATIGAIGYLINRLFLAITMHSLMRWYRGYSAKV